jgi:hypothetical protein
MSARHIFAHSSGLLDAQQVSQRSLLLLGDCEEITSRSDHQHPPTHQRRHPHHDTSGTVHPGVIAARREVGDIHTGILEDFISGQSSHHRLPVHSHSNHAPNTEGTVPLRRPNALGSFESQQAMGVSTGNFSQGQSHCSVDTIDMDASTNVGGNLEPPARLYTIVEQAIAAVANIEADMRSRGLVGGGATSGGTHGPGTTVGGMPSALLVQQQKRDLIEHTWERVRRWLWKYTAPEDRHDAATYQRGGGPCSSDGSPTPPAPLVDGAPPAPPLLHLLCQLHHPPDDVIAALVDVAPEIASWTDGVHGWLPLHHVCANGCSTETLLVLLEAYPDGKTTRDLQCRTPLHFYATRNTGEYPAIMSQQAAMLSDTGAAMLPDRGGMLPIHYAAAYGSHPAIMEVLVNAAPSSVVAGDLKKGRTPMHLIMVNAHRESSVPTLRFLLEHSEESRDAINTRDKDGFLPLHLMALGLRGYRGGLSGRGSNSTSIIQQRAHVSECLKLYLDAEPRAESDFLTAIQDLPDWLQDTAVVSKHVRNVLNTKLVNRFPTSILMLDGSFLFIIIICFEITTRHYIDQNFNSENALSSDKSTQGPAFVFLFLGVVYFLLREVVQIVSCMSLGSIRKWLRDPGNWLDVVVITLVAYYGIIMVEGSYAVDGDTFRGG